MKKLFCMTALALVLALPAQAVRYGVKKMIPPIGTGQIPTYLGYSPTSDRMYSGNVGYSNVTAMSCANDSLLGIVPGTIYSAPMVYDAVNNRLYMKSSDYFYAIDCASDILDTNLMPSNGASGVEYNPDNNKIYVYEGLLPDIFVLDPATYASTGTINNASGLMHYFSPNNSLYTPYYSAAGGPQDSLRVVSGATNSVITSIYLPGLISAINEKMASNPALNRLYLAMPNTDQVAIINTATNTLVNTVSVADNPNNFALCPVNDRMFIACNGTSQYSLKYINGSDLLDSVAVGDSVSTVVYNPADSLIYIGCRRSGYVKLVDPRLATPAVVDSVYTTVSPQFADMSVDNGGDVYCAITNSDNIFVIGQIPNRIWRTVSSGSWDFYMSWQYSDDGGTSWGNVLTAYPDCLTDSLVTIQAGDTMSISSVVVLDQVQVYGQLAINPAAAVTIADGPGEDVVVNGSFSQNGGALSFNIGATLRVASLGAYNHAMNGGVIPAAVWDSLSTLYISGVTSAMPTGMDQAFGNITWDCLSQAVDAILPGGPAFAAKNLIVGYTGSNNLYLTSTAKPSLTLDNFSISNGTAILGAGGPRNLHVKGDLNITPPGWLYLTDTLNAGIDTLFLYGNYAHLAVGIGGGGPDSTTIVFCGTDTQNYNPNGEILTGYINYKVNPGSFLKVAEWATLGQGSLGSFTLMPGATLAYSDMWGISPTGQDAGVIRNLGARNYSQGANYYIYSTMTGPYYTGPGLPDTVNQLTIESFGDQVYLNKDLAVMDTLKLLANNLRIDGRKLSVFGQIYSTSGNLISDSLSTLAVMGGNPAGLTLPSGIQSLGTLIVNRPALITTSDSLNIYSGYTQTQGRIGFGQLRYKPTAVLTYNGTVSDTTSDQEFPVINGPLNLAVQTAAALQLHTNRTIKGTLILNGPFITGASTITIDTAGRVVQGTGFGSRKEGSIRPGFRPS
ncbi:MAG: hypothetical protein Q8O74_05335, partial [bacterium]|nr:hypothetical protein [bacterium]